MLNRRTFLKLSTFTPFATIGCHKQENIVHISHLLQLATPLFHQLCYFSMNQKTVMYDNTKSVTVYRRYDYDNTMSFHIQDLSVKIKIPALEKNIEEIRLLLQDEVETACRKVIIEAGKNYSPIVGSKEDIINNIQLRLGSDCHIFNGWENDCVIGVKRNNPDLYMLVLSPPTLYNHKNFFEGTIRIGVHVDGDVCLGHLEQP